jgi:hypothetical protein
MRIGSEKKFRRFDNSLVCSNTSKSMLTKAIHPVFFLFQAQFIMSSFVNISVDYEKLSFHPCVSCSEPDPVIMQFVEQSIRTKIWLSQQWKKCGC